MPKIKFNFLWSIAWQKKYNIPQGFLLIKPDKSFKKILYDAFKKINKKQLEKDQLENLEATVSYFYKKRNLDQNALMHKLYDLEAYVLNSGLSGARDHTIIGWELYNQDIKEYADVITYECPEHLVEIIKQKYRIVLDVNEIESKPGFYKIRVYFSTSHFDIYTMAKWIDRIFNRISYYGVPIEKTADITNFKMKWMNFLNDKKISIHDGILTSNEYKKANPLCEGCLDFIGNGSGHLAHIKTIGMGGNPENFKQISSNWLHLCPKCHLGIQHQSGWNKFIKLYPYLSYKINNALNRSKLNENTN